ncbi:MAG: multicopper oxidase domain-containing protein [Alphaproteobacteria bacterium]|nr:multicopper oxidase domain-containing protein [Alphaproteobacteria bacterium]
MVELLAHFDQLITKDTPFMFHCHVLEHDGSGMMGHFKSA